MINPQTGAITRTRTNRTTQYPWLSEDHADMFPDLDLTHLGGTMTGNVFAENYFQDYQPTNDPLYFDPEMGYDRYIFELMRRDPNQVSRFWDQFHHRWRVTSDFDDPVMRSRDMFTSMGYDIANMFQGDTLFTTTDDLVGVVHPEQLRETETALWDYNVAEYNHMHTEFTARFDEFLRIAPDVDQNEFLELFEQLAPVKADFTWAWFKQKYGQQMQNMNVLVDAAEQGATTEQLNGALQMLIDDPLALLQVGDTGRAGLEIPEELTEEQIERILDDSDLHIGAEESEQLDRELADLVNRDTRVLEPTEPPPEVVDDIADEQALRDYYSRLAEDIMREDYITAMRDNPEIADMTFREATLIISEGEDKFEAFNDPDNIRYKKWREVFDEAVEDYEYEIVFGEPARAVGAIRDLETARIHEVRDNPLTEEFGFPEPELEIFAVEDPNIRAALEAFNQRFELLDTLPETNAAALDALTDAANEGGIFPPEGIQVEGIPILEAAGELETGAETGLEALLARGLIGPAELMLGIAGLVQISSFTFPYYTPEQQLEIDRQKAQERQFYEHNTDIIDTYRDQDVFVNIGGYWYRGHAPIAYTIKDNIGFNNVDVAKVTLTDRDGETVTVPITPNTLLLDNGTWEPPIIATWAQYERQPQTTEPDTETETTEVPVEPVDGVPLPEEPHQPGITHPRIPATTQRDDPTVRQEIREDVGTRTDPWTDPGTDPERVPATTERGDPTVRQDIREDVGTYDPQRTDPWTDPGTDHERVPATTERGDPTVKQDVREDVGTYDHPEVMSYLHKEHNEVYTIWKNPNYTGTDPNRVERIFGGIVPFMSYNSEGHPILVNDQELDHHGHTEFNMVHISPIEMQEQATGQVNVENEATITQTTQNDEPTGEGNR